MQIRASQAAHILPTPRNTQYGVIGLSAEGKAISIIEKPQNLVSKYANTGLYFLDSDAPERADYFKPSKRGELEITNLLNTYLQEDALSVE